MSAARLAGTYALGAAGAAAALGLSLPLPWLLGPLLATGSAAAAGAARPVLPGGRQAGQLAVGAALGLYFTAEVLATMAGALPWMAATCVAVFAAGMAGASLLARRARLAPATAFYAAVPGGAAEMAVLGEQSGGDPAVIALAQALRIAAVVTVVPLALALAGAHGADAWAPRALPASAAGLARLGLWALGAGAAAQLLRIPNGWLLGPLAASAWLTASGRGASAVPRPVLEAAQLLIGCALGSRFRRELLRAARVLLPALAAAVAQGVLLLAAFAGVAATLSGRSAFTLLLATAPGGIAEMALTARNLQLGVPLVVAFHVARLAALLTLAPTIYRLWLVVSRRRPLDSSEACPPRPEPDVGPLQRLGAGGEASPGIPPAAGDDASP